MKKKLKKSLNMQKRTVEAYACVCGCNDCNPCQSVPSTAYMNQKDSYIYRGAAGGISSVR